MAILPPKIKTVKYTDRETLSKIYLDHIAKTKSGASGSYESPSSISGEAVFTVTSYPNRRYNSSGFLFPGSFIQTIATAYANSASSSSKNYFAAISNYMGLNRSIPVIPAASTDQTPVWLAMNDGTLEVFDENPPIAIPDSLAEDDCCKLPVPNSVLNEDGTPIVPLNPDCPPDHNMNPWDPTTNPGGYIGSFKSCTKTTNKRISVNGRLIGSHDEYESQDDEESPGEFDLNHPIFQPTDDCPGAKQDVVVGSYVQSERKQDCFEIKIPRFSVLLPTWGLDPRDFPVNPDGSVTLTICIETESFCNVVVTHSFGHVAPGWVYNPEFGVWEYVPNNEVAYPKVNDCPTCDDLTAPIEPSQWINTIGNGPETAQPGNYNNIGSGGCLNC